jgi:pimeloyl-ACP methyl ester carboxylesterase
MTSSARPTSAMAQRCGPPDREAALDTVSGADGATLAVASVGSGDTVALLLHQTDSVASCGWWPFANRLAEAGIRAVLLDFCGYGKSRCDTSKRWASDYVDQVVRTVAQLRAKGATRVTLVGASLGGTVATVSAAAAGVDAVVNLSGFGFGSLVTGPSLATLKVPVLGIGSHSEESDSASLQAQVNGSASPTKRFLWGDVGHGWSLVLDGPQPDAPVSAVGQAVLSWVKGQYSA